MKKTLAIIVMMIMVFAAFTGCGRSEKESRGDRTARILTSYIGCEDCKEGTTFEFLDRDSAEGFQDYWLDWGQTVSGVIENTDDGHYYVTICNEYDFQRVCEEVVMEMNNEASPKKDRK